MTQPATLELTPEQIQALDIARALRKRYGWCYSIGEPCAVYRHYTQTGVLLYVGITRNLGRRWAQHKRRSLWAQLGLVARITAEWHPNEASARSAETKAIHQEVPYCNRLRPRRQEAAS